MHSLPKYLENRKQTLLNKGGKKAAWDIINEYFQYTTIESIKEELWLLTKSTITNDLVEQAEDGADRHNLIFGYEFLVLLLEAVHQLYQIRKEKIINDQ